MGEENPSSGFPILMGYPSANSEMNMGFQENKPIIVYSKN